MQNRLQDQTLAITALFQAGALVDQLAKKGTAPEEPYKTSIMSLFIMDPENTEAVYGGDPGYHEGLDLGIRTLKEVLTRYQNLGGAEMVRYGLSMLFLSRKLQAKRGMMDKVGETLQEIYAQVDESGPTDLPIISALSRCYQESLSTFRFRIHVQGDGRYLQDQEVADQIRAVLLAGVRAAILWRQVGGRRWHLLFYRNRIRRALNEIA